MRCSNASDRFRTLLLWLMPGIPLMRCLYVASQNSKSRAFDDGAITSCAAVISPEDSATRRTYALPRVGVG